MSNQPKPGDLLSTVEALMTPDGMDAAILRRMKYPISHELIRARSPARHSHYRIRDKNDDAICSTHERVYADLIVEALNKLNSSK